METGETRENKNGNEQRMNEVHFLSVSILERSSGHTDLISIFSRTHFIFFRCSVPSVTNFVEDLNL